jgi:hypothetical protein
LPNCAGRWNGTTVVLLQVPCRSGAPHGVFIVAAADGVFEAVWPIIFVLVKPTAIKIAALSAMAKKCERARILTVALLREVRRW